MNFSELGCETKGDVSHNGTETKRFILAKTNGGENPLICFGVNPSNAGLEDPDDSGKFRLDPTMSRVEELASRKDNSYTGWIMLNLYPQRTANPRELFQDGDSRVEKLIEENLKIIERVLAAFPKSDLWAAWGNAIDTRRYLHQALFEIADIASERKWLARGTLTKSGNPRHPLYLKSDERFNRISIVRDVRVELKG